MCPDQIIRAQNRPDPDKTAPSGDRSRGGALRPRGGEYGEPGAGGSRGALSWPSAVDQSSVAPGAYSFSNPCDENLSTRPFSVTVRTTWSGAPAEISASTSSVTVTWAPTSPQRWAMTSSAMPAEIAPDAGGVEGDRAVVAPGLRHCRRERRPRRHRGSPGPGGGPGTGPTGGVVTASASVRRRRGPSGVERPGDLKAVGAPVTAKPNERRTGAASATQGTCALGILSGNRHCAARARTRYSR